MIQDWTTRGSRYETPIGVFETHVIKQPHDASRFNLSLNGEILWLNLKSTAEVHRAVEKHLETTLKGLQEFLRPAQAETNLEKAKRLYPPGTEIVSGFSNQRGRIIGNYWTDNAGNVSTQVEDGYTLSLYNKASNNWAVITRSQCGENTVSAEALLLLEAKRRYPLGTVFKSVKCGAICSVYSRTAVENDQYIFVDHNAVYNKDEAKWADVIKFECPKCDGVTKDSNHCGNPCCPVQPCCGDTKARCRCIWENADMSKMQP